MEKESVRDLAKPVELKDYFASFAMKAIMSWPSTEESLLQIGDKNRSDTLDFVSFLAYDLAKKMLEARILRSEDEEEFSRLSGLCRVPENEK